MRVILLQSLLRDREEAEMAAAWEDGYGFVFDPHVLLLRVDRQLLNMVSNMY